ncbi:MAG: hypothetical protein QME60_03960 [Verrucomicrobiota bacterium]|nr:hypothetical protein [Verrucomicrobiota bacterium]
MGRYLVCWLALGLAAAGLTGCEQGNGLDELNLAPSSATLFHDNNGVDFVVEGDTNATRDSLALPLEWSVSDASLGVILYYSGWTARYRRNAADGENTITVENQFGQKGHAVIRQK